MLILAIGTRIFGRVAAAVLPAPRAVAIDMRAAGVAGIKLRLNRDTVINARHLLRGSLLLADGPLADALLATGAADPADPAEVNTWRAMQQRKRLSPLEEHRKRGAEEQVRRGSRLWY